MLRTAGCELSGVFSTEPIRRPGGGRWGRGEDVQATLQTGTLLCSPRPEDSAAHPRDAGANVCAFAFPPAPGVYVCAKCGYELFSSRSKYAHSSPWPAFTETIHADSVAKHPERNSPTALKVGAAAGGAEGVLARESLRAGHSVLLCASPHSSRGLESVYSRPLASARGAAPPNSWESLGS